MVGDPPSGRCLSVVIPCFNEADHVRECVRRVLKEMLVLEVLLVDDGSTDGTRDAIARIVDSRVRVFHHATNNGKGAALRTGFNEAVGDLVIVQDADLEQDPADYGRLAGPILEGSADVVYGTRFPTLRRQPGQQLLHYLANRALTWLSNRMTGLCLTDMETGYKVFRREVVAGFRLNEDRFGVEPELTAKIAAGGWRVQEVPVSYRPRNVAEGKKIGWRDGIRAFVCIVRYSGRPSRGGGDGKSKF
jgi:glycosyltransferase involved in cell wall biosynthesis